MALVYTSDELVEAVKNLGMIPEAQSLGCEDTEILGHLSAVLQSQLALELLKVREEYYVVSQRIPLVAGQTDYRIPTRAMGLKLRDVFYYDTAGDYQHLPSIAREDFERYAWDTTEPDGYYLEGNYICLVVGSSPTGSLEVSYFFRPSDLVLAASARQITNVTSQTVTFASDVPSSWTTADTFDCHSQYSGAEVKVWDASASAVGLIPDTNKIVFTTSITGSTHGTHPVEVGDWVCLAGECVVPALPREFHPILVRGACLRMAEAQGDEKAIQFHGTLFRLDLERTTKILESRVEGRPLKIKGTHGILWQ